MQTHTASWFVGDNVTPKVGNTVEVSLKNKISGKGYHRFYGKIVAEKWGRHEIMYKVDAKSSSHGGRFTDFVFGNQITGIKLGDNHDLNMLNLLTARRSRGG